MNCVVRGFSLAKATLKGHATLVGVASTVVKQGRTLSWQKTKHVVRGFSLAKATLKGRATVAGFGAIASKRGDTINVWSVRSRHPQASPFLHSGLT